MMVEPESFCWLSGRRVAQRTGETWSEELAKYPSLSYLVSDAGKALARAVQLQRARRPDLQHGLDVFHTLSEGNVSLGRMYRAAARALKAAGQTQREVDKRKADGICCSGKAGVAAKQWRKTERLLDQAAQAEEAWRECQAALSWFTPAGQLNDRRQAQAVLDRVLPRLPGAGWDKTRRLLQGPETLTFLDRLHEQLGHLGLEENTLAALVRLEGLRRHPEQLQGASAAAAAARGEVLIRTVQLAKADPDWQSKAQQVRLVLRRAWRASSLVEGINSVARMQQARHRRMTQGLLDLKRFYWNLRRFRTGKRRGRTPYEILGLRVPQKSWWELLKLTPEQLRQELSGQ
jgi:hypothetical protein